jgi:hypothetical protein
LPWASCHWRFKKSDAHGLPRLRVQSKTVSRFFHYRLTSMINRLFVFSIGLAA